MIRVLQKLLKRVLSPAAFWRTKYCWWYIRVYTLRRFIAIFIQRPPAVSGPSSDFADKIRGVNTFATTEMCRVMTQFGSDKGRFNHNYTTIYSALFGSLRDQPLRIFELGIGTNNLNLASSMGAMGRPGASLRGWRALFPKAQVFGADIDRDILFADDGIRTFYCDQLDSNAIRDLWAQAAMEGGLDIIVDDGLHSFPGNASFLAGSLEQVRAGGVYIVEDITDGDLVEWRRALDGYVSKYSNFDFAIVQLPAPSNPGDNNLLMIRRRS